MGEVDKTKENIRVDRIDEESRKKLFNDFVSAGGEVISPSKTRRKALIIDRDKQTSYTRRIEEHQRRQRAEANTDKTSRKANSTMTTQQAGTGKAGFWEKISISLHLRFMKIARGGGKYLNPVFLNHFLNVYKPALMELQIIFMDVFVRNTDTSRRVINRLDKQNPLFYELLQMTGDVYDKMLIDRIVEPYQQFPDVPKRLSEFREPLMTVLKKLAVLKPYENTILNSYIKALNFLDSIEKKKGSESSSNKKKVKKDLFIIFNKLYPKLLWLLCRYEGNTSPLILKFVYDILGISEEAKPGKRTAQLKQQESESQSPDPAVSPSESVEEEDQLDPDVKRGLQLMYRLDYRSLKQEYDRSKQFEGIDISDKVYLCFLLFSEFEKEYSFILTTNKITFNPDYSRGDKTGFRQRLQDMYNMMRKPWDTLKDYSDIYRDYEKAKGEKPLNSGQYISYTQRLKELNDRKVSAAKTARNSVYSFMAMLLAALQELINDMDTSQKYISNPQDVLEFEDNIEGKKKMAGTKIYEALADTAAYAAAFIYRLSPGGDLYGSLEKSNDEEKAVIEKAVQERTGQDSPADDTADKTIFDELEDLL